VSTHKARNLLFLGVDIPPIFYDLLRGGHGYGHQMLSMPGFHIAHVGVHDAIGDGNCHLRLHRIKANRQDITLVFRFNLKMFCDEKSSAVDLGGVGAILADESAQFLRGLCEGGFNVSTPERKCIGRPE
jgi:hypothetical protein